MLAWLRDPRSEPSRPAAVRWLLLVLAGSALLVLPFHLTFDPSARGIGVVQEGRGFAGWLRDELLLFGSLAGLVAWAYAGRLMATRRPGRNAAWIAVAAVFAGSLLAALEYAHVALLAVALLIALGALFSARVEPAARLVWLLVAGGVACLLGPELLYVRDEFDDGPLYRMNTVFKLGYQGWLLLGLAGIGALAWRGEWLARRRLRWTLGPLAMLLVAASFVYPIAGTYARKDAFTRAPTLDGLGWLRDRAPGDVGAIGWLNDEAAAGEVVLESVGDDYSAFGHARISTFTGLPAVLGWPGHELQWGHRRRVAQGGRGAHVRVADDGGRAGSADPLRGALRGGGPARAHGVRRRWSREVGPARGARVRARRHDGVGAPTPKLRTSVSPRPRRWSARKQWTTV